MSQARVFPIRFKFPELPQELDISIRVLSYSIFYGPFKQYLEFASVDCRRLRLQVLCKLAMLKLGNTEMTCSDWKVSRKSPGLLD